MCVWQPKKNARGAVLCSHPPALTRESLVPVSETLVKNYSVRHSAQQEEDQHELHHVKLDGDEMMRNVNASTRAHNWSTTLDGRSPINN